ncbi:site-specific integrase [Hymenobacter sp. CA1UV-4]|nr:site-specific integrase [Hymenobacter sp. CA1UV-4]
MSLYADYKQTKIKTGLRVEPKQWDMEGQKCKTRGKGLDKSNGQTNDDLTGMAERAIAYYGAQRAMGRVPKGAEIWEAIKPVEDEADPVVDNGPQPLADFEAYILHVTPKSSPSTIKAKRTTLRHLTDYIESTGQPFGYTNFTREFKEKFAAYLANRVGLADNTLAKVLTILKGFLSYAAEHHRTPRIDVTGWGWKFKEPDIVALTTAELESIEQLSNLQPYLSNARDLFLLMCYTGLRYSDAVRLKPEHDKKDYLELTAQKTKDVLTIYIRRALRPILSKYWSGELRLISNQKLNKFIKELGELAAIDTPIEITRSYGQTSQPVQETRPKHELIGCHTGRRTFVTLSIDRDAPADVVMQATGHKNHRTMQRYNKTTPARQVAAMRKVLGEEGE